MPRLGLGGGGAYVGQRNYHRSHDFRSEREPETKPPKVETHYTSERPTESYRQPTFYRPELDQAALEKVVGQTIEKYRNEREKELDSQAYVRSETTPDSHDVEKPLEEMDSTRLGITTGNEHELPVQADPLVEISQGTDMNIDKGLERFEPIDLPVADLELLLVELEANPLELRPEKNIEAEVEQK